MMEAIVDEVQETEEQAAARVRAARLRKALAAAPMLAYELRWDTVPLDGRTEAGLWKRHERTPLLTGAVDLADELYAYLHGWAAYWGDRMDIEAPAPWMWRRHSDGKPLGMHAAATPEEAHSLTYSVAAWLLWHDDTIAKFPDAFEYQDDAASAVWDARSTAGLTRPRERTPILDGFQHRPCPRCGEDEVRVEYFGGPIAYVEHRERLNTRPRHRRESQEEIANEFMAAIAGVEVRCAVCGWVAPTRPTQIARWLA